MLRDNLSLLRSWPPLVTGFTDLHDNGASPDACRWSVVTNAIRKHVKWTSLWKIVKKIRNWIIGAKFFPFESENSLLHVKKITALPTVSFLFYRWKMESFFYSLGSRQMRKKTAKWAAKSAENVREWCPKQHITTPPPPTWSFLWGFNF